MVNITGLFPKQQVVVKNILSSNAKYHIIKAGRQSGKSFVMSKLLIAFALTTSNNILVATPLLSQGMVIRDNIMSTKGIRVFLTKATLRKSSPMIIEFISGCKVFFRSTKVKDGLRSGSYQYVFVDEFAFINIDTWYDEIRPLGNARRDSKFILASTPKGFANIFYEMYALGENPDEEFYNKYDMHYSDNPEYDMKEVRTAEIIYPEKKFLEEYEGEFQSDGGDVFANLKAVMTIDKNLMTVDPMDRYFGGIDWGRVVDSSVLTIVNSNLEQVYVQEFKGDWAIQAKDMSIPINHFKAITYVESNGPGDAALSHLRPHCQNIREFFTTNKKKTILVEYLRGLMIKEGIQLQNNAKQYKELANYTWLRTSTNLYNYTHRPGEHDDYIDSILFAIHAHKQHSKGVDTVIYDTGNAFYDRYNEQSFFD